MAFSRTTLVLALFVVLIGSALAQGPSLAPESDAFAPSPSLSVTADVAVPTSSDSFEGEGPASSPGPVSGEFV
ncbi:hypothetical protein RND81_06G224400 [Saponaria officinalis]|uniref:Uncharacterized protein n=1 Tax=Saponaria officinalis TaxID=3572 RepID=A0AAW1K9M0_SAPOF